MAVYQVRQYLNFFVLALIGVIDPTTRIGSAPNRRENRRSRAILQNSDWKIRFLVSSSLEGPTRKPRHAAFLERSPTSKRFPHFTTYDCCNTFFRCAVSYSAPRRCLPSGFQHAIVRFQNARFAQSSCFMIFLFGGGSSGCPGFVLLFLFR